MSRWWWSSSGSGVVGFSGMSTSTSLRHCVRRATDDAFMSPVSGCQCRKRIHTELPARCPGRVGPAKYWGTRAPHAVGKCSPSPVLLFVSLMQALFVSCKFSGVGLPAILGGTPLEVFLAAPMAVGRVQTDQDRSLLELLGAN
jgi:hypothetical protein